MTEKKKRFYLYIEIILLLWFAIFTFLNGDVQSLWADELSSIGYIKNGLSLGEMFETYLYLDTNLPLYSVILYFWYRIVPYGEQFLLIPSILFCMGGIIFLAAAVKKLLGERASLIAFCLGCSSNAVIWQGAWEVRCYSLVFFLSAFSIWAYIEKTLHENKKMLFIYGAAVTLFLWTHWFACVLLTFYGLADLCFIIRKKCSWKVLLCYPLGLLAYCPWLIVSFVSKSSELQDFWAEVPQWKNMPWTILFFLSGRRILWYVCLAAGGALCIKTVISFFYKHMERNTIINLGFICTLSIGWVIGLVFLYSAYLNPEGSLYVERYFMVIAPQILMITAWGIEYLIIFSEKITQYLKAGWLKKSFPVIVRSGIALALCFYFLICYKEAYISIRKPRQEFRYLSEYLIGEGKLWNDDTALVGSNRYCALDGFIDYYFVKRGVEAPANIIDGKINEKEESRFYKNYDQWSKEELLNFNRIYCLKIHMGYDDALKEFLEGNYQLVLADYDLGLEIWEK